jgi:hypothetical protein
MDPVANKIEQMSVAKQILAIWDDCNGDGTLTKGQSEEMCDLANRLAELVEALAGWENWARLKNTLVR